MTEPTLIKADAVIGPICQALGLNEREVGRIILDLQTGYPVQAYISMYGNEGLIDIDWTAALSGAAVITCELDTTEGELVSE